MNMNVLDCGAVGDGVADDTDAVQGAIDACSSSGGGVVSLQQGRYLCRTLRVRYAVTLRGDGPQSTTIVAKRDVTTPLITFAPGPVQYSRIEDMQLKGVMNPGQHCVYAECRGNGIDTPNHGGWWSGGMRNVRIGNFAGVGVWIRGQGLDGLTPFQYLEFTGVECHSTADYESLLISGTGGQIEISGGFWAGPEPKRDNGSVASVRICRTLADDRKTFVDDAAPYAVRFLGGAIQSNGVGLWVDRTPSVSVFGTHFEDCGNAITAVNMGGVLASAPYILSTGWRSDGAGVAFRSNNGGVINVQSPVFFGPSDAHSSGAVTMTDAVYTDLRSTGPVTAGATKQVSVEVDGGVTVGPQSTVVVNTTSREIKTIRSWRGPGESVYLRALGGPICLNWGGNVNPGSNTFPLTIPQDGVVQLVRFDLAAMWTVVGKW